MCLLWYNKFVNNNTKINYTPKQGRFPVFISDLLEISDPVIAFDRVMEAIGVQKYLKGKVKSTGRLGYNPVNLLKTVLFAFRDKGYASLRTIDDECRVNIRYMYLMDYETPSYHTFGNFINEYLEDSIEDIFKDINEYLFEQDHVDLNHLYIDGSKFEANANKYTFVWKKATEKYRYALFAKITELFEKMNQELSYEGVTIQINTEYVPAYLDEVLSSYRILRKIDESTFAHGKGHRKTAEQRNVEKLIEYRDKLSEYVEKLETCGEDRNSYSKTDPSATFMRMKRDYMGNDQLLPAYNVQVGVADEYIAVVDVNRYRSDMDCFVPLMEKFKSIYGFYPKYPVADAGYGSYNNYIFCQENGMEKYMKFTMYQKEVKDEKYRDNPFRAVNFKIDDKGNLRCPNNKKMIFSHRKPVKNNNYGRQEEIYRCEDCSGCPYAEQCKKTDKNRTISLNQELTAMHREVLENLECIHGALLRTNRSIQAEGTFGVIKYDRWYKRMVRKGQQRVKLEIYLVSIGFNLHKFYNKQNRLQKAA
jgi:transposase